MYYCKDFNSLVVLSLFEGDLIGRVDKLHFDKKLKKLCEIELVGADGAKLSLSSKNIYNVGKNAITVKNNQAVELKTDNEEFIIAPIGCKAYSITGEFLGVVEELGFNEKFLSQKVYLDNGEVLDIKNMASCGINTIIFYIDEQKINVNNFKPLKQPKLFKGKNVQTTAVLPVENIEEETRQDQKQEMKPVVVQDSNFLIGRVCTKDIFNFNNELLIKAHSVVNKKNLKEIGRFGKLRELMLYLK